MYFTSSNSSSNDEGEEHFTHIAPEQSIFPNLSTSEELRIIRARIRILEMKKTKTMGTSSGGTSDDVTEQNTEMDDDDDNCGVEVSSSFDEDTKQQQQYEKRKTAKIAFARQFKAILKRITELETNQHKQNEKVTKALVGQMKQLQNDHQKQLERISELEKQQAVIFDQLHTAQKQIEDRISQPQTDQQPTELCAKISELETNTKILFGKVSDQFSEFGNFVGILKDRFGRELLNSVHPKIRVKICEKFSNLPLNCWDANACHKNLQIFGSECLIIHYKEAESAWVSVFAKYSVPSSEIGGLFYFEVKIIHLRNCAKIGFSAKAMAFCEKAEGLYSYVYRNEGEFWTHCTSKKGKPKYSRDDVIGCGVNLASGRIIFTKNGQPLDTADLFVCPSSPSANDDDDDDVDHRLFPCVSLADSGDLIEANFGPNFKFDPANAEEHSNTKQRNCWDLAVCHNEITISGPHNLIVHHKGSGNGWRSVFAKYSILHNAVTESIDMFYFETPLDGAIQNRTGTYAFDKNGNFWVDKISKNGGEKFADEDTVGCGVNLANQKLIFTKNGHQLDGTNSLLLSSSVPVDSLFPFVSLTDCGDKISTNFGPNFMFDLANL
ncbi:hypothetical protein niasHT_004543 [Heterodera trifolii]|uniref:B30.2/SPRY domain-containing protein n=1 Tax=Heterodera trifolii TaxID=157864 RepID=A0ABD2M1E0_9BILA